jgi:subtilisin family serine protease
MIDSFIENIKFGFKFFYHHFCRLMSWIFCWKKSNTVKIEYTTNSLSILNNTVPNPKTYIITDNGPKYMNSPSMQTLLDLISHSNSYSNHQIGIAKKAFYDIYKVDLDGSTVNITIIDTGLQWFDHFNFNRGYFYNKINSYDINKFIDDNNHGTHVGGIIWSIAPKSQLNCIKALDSLGNGNFKILSESINLVVTNYAPIVNLSVGVQNNDSSVNSAINNLYANGSIPICAAGNVNTYVTYPGKNTNTLCVAAVNNDNILANFSGKERVITSQNVQFLYENNTKPWYVILYKYFQPGKYIFYDGSSYYYKDVLAGYYYYGYNYFNIGTYAYTDAVSYGVNVVSINAKNYVNTNKYISMSGTSMATPQVSGIVALIIDALIKSYCINSNKRIPHLSSGNPPTSDHINLLRKAAIYTYNNIIFNSKYYKDIDEYNASSNGNTNDINGSCGRGLIQLNLVINDIINETLKLT